MRVRPPLGPLPSWVPRDISWIHSNIFYLGRLDEIKIQSLPLPQFVKDGGSRINTPAPVRKYSQSDLRPNILFLC